MAFLKRIPSACRSGLSVLTLCLLVIGCGGSSSTTTQPLADNNNNGDTGAEQGTVVVGLTDAEGDFLEYQVTVLSVALTRENGVVVETLPLATSVDFAQYTELTEFLTIATVPAGKYVAASLTLDYADAQVQTEDVNGEPVVTSVVDENGAPAGVVELNIEFADSDGFRILPGVPAHITLDFDLAGSHVLDQSVSPALAMLTGVLLADTLLEDPKTRRARGMLIGVNLDAQQFDINLRPFYRHDGRFGQLTVSTDSETEYEINGVAFTGHEGLVALSGEPADTPLVASGQLHVGDRRFLADVVYAGSSVPFGDKDIATGTVIAREQNQLILRGVALVNKQHKLRRVRQLRVQLGDNTTVTQVKSSFAEFGVADISVGQRITVMGDLETTDGNTDVVTLNAQEGHARLLFTQIHGRVTEVAPLVLDLSSINRQALRHFNFAGTGVSADQDANPEAYTVDTGTLPLEGVEINSALKARGFVAPFGTAPGDFWAQTIGDVTQVPGHSRVRWADGQSDGAVLNADETGITLDIGSSARAFHIFTGHIPLNMKSANQPWTLQPSDSGRGVFALITRDSRQVFTHFDEFVAALLRELGGDQHLAAVHSRDILVPSSLTSEARSIVVYLR